MAASATGAEVVGMGVGVPMLYPLCTLLVPITPYGRASRVHGSCNAVRGLVPTYPAKTTDQQAKSGPHGVAGVGGAGVTRP